MGDRGTKPQQGSGRGGVTGSGRYGGDGGAGGRRGWGLAVRRPAQTHARVAAGGKPARQEGDRESRGEGGGGGANGDVRARGGQPPRSGKWRGRPRGEVGGWGKGHGGGSVTSRRVLRVQQVAGGREGRSRRGRGGEGVEGSLGGDEGGGGVGEAGGRRPSPCRPRAHTLRTAPAACSEHPAAAAAAGGGKERCAARCGGPAAPAAAASAPPPHTHLPRTPPRAPRTNLFLTERGDRGFV